MVGHPALEFAPRRDHRVPHVEELVGGFDRAEDVDAAVSARLQPRLQSRFAQHVTHGRGDGRGIREIRSGLRIEIDPQFDGIVGVTRERGPRVEDDGVHLDRPDDRGRLVEDDLRTAARLYVHITSCT